jgi:hypothetical protein
MNTEGLYLRDLGVLLKETALKAREERKSASEDEREYAEGRLMAMHEVVSLMQQQAHAFGIELETLGLADIEPEKDLL